MLWLVGMMASGKSTVGEAAAQDIGCAFVDMDLVLEARWGPLPRQWKEVGEDVFRQREADLVQELALGDRRMIVSTGGGVVLSQASVEAMRASGTVVWLRAVPATVRQRLSGGPHRPPLATRRVEDLDEERKDLYRDSADIIIDTDELPIEEVASKVVAVWK
ncbi:MAG: shikimate kinase [Acidimicrobiia bacterium]